MARWHQEFCSDPRIAVEEDGNPGCNTCGSKCDWQKLIKTRAFANAPHPIPPDEPHTELNLWWPPSVPYVDQHQLANSPDSTLDPSSSSSTLRRHSPTAIYPTGLAPHEFRLVCLTAVDSPQSPVHLTLETYSQDDSPDYETVSYTWGGEAADSNPTKPIFIGPYWDVMFQTRNCWEMLRFIRPWRGIRMIWVDAICINQNSNEERAEQVAKMMQIYRTSTSVIVYLGPDIATPPPRGRFPPRRRLDDLALGSREDQDAFKSLLQRRYFKRIWVIQELILPPQAVVPIRGINYWADAMVHSRLESAPDWDWDATAAPWLQHAAQGGIWGGTMAQVLRMTAKSRGSDPRDQVFGVLGLVDQGPDSRPGLQVNYGISAQHVFVGLFAYLISELRLLDVLYHATRVSMLSRASLTWMPPWEPSSVWDFAFDPPPPLDLDLADKLIIGLKPEIKVSCYTNFNQSWARVGSQDTSTASSGNVFLYIKLGRSRTVTAAQNTSFSFARWLGDICKRKPWHTGLNINAHTGVLSLILTHFCSIPFQPQEVGDVGAWTIFEVRGSQGSLFLASRDRLGSICDPNLDEVFILNPGEGEQLWYLILRRVTDCKGWILVSTCRAMFLTLDADASNVAKGIEICIEPGFQSLHTLLTPAMPWLENNVGEMTLPANFGSASSLSDVLPGVKTGWDAFPSYRAWHDWDIHDFSTRNNERFLRSCVSCLDPKLRPFARVRSLNGKDVLEVKSPQPEAAGGTTQGQLNEGPASPNSAGSVGPQGRNSLGRRKSLWRSLKIKKISSEVKMEEETQRHDSAGLIKADCSGLTTAVEAHFRQVEAIRKTLGLSFDELETLLRPGLQDEQHFVGILNFGGKMDDFNIDGNTVRVSIL